MPHFINQLTVTGIELGNAMPSIHHVSSPYLDERGFWLDLDVEYSGGICLSMETKCNLMRLKYATSMSSSCINEESTAKLGRSVEIASLCSSCLVLWRVISNFHQFKCNICCRCYFFIVDWKTKMKK